MGSHSYYEFEPQRNYTGWLLLGFVVSVLIFALIFSSCSPTKRIGGLAVKHPDAVKRVCADMFPPEVKTVTNTEYIHGATIYDTAMVFVDCDSVIAMAKSHGKDGKTMVQTKLVRVPCPPSTHSVDTFVKTETITIENKAKIEVLTKDLADSRADEDRLRKGRNTWRYIALGALVMLLGGAVLKLRKII